MPDDRQGKMPTWVEVKWVIPTAEYNKWSDDQETKPSSERYSDAAMAESKRRWEALPHYSKRIDLRPVIAPELLEKVRSNRQNTQLKLTFTFEGSDLDVKAMALKWR